MYTIGRYTVSKVCEVAGVWGGIHFFSTASLGFGFIKVICYLSSIQQMYLSSSGVGYIPSYYLPARVLYHSIL